MTEKIRLNIGAGDTKIPGFIPLDIKSGTEAWKLPYRDGEVDEVYSSHCLEHIHHSKTVETVKEWVRVLKPGGRIRIAVPDFQKILEAGRTGEMSMPMLNAWLHGSAIKANDPHDKHQFVATWEGMAGLLRGLAIDGIGQWDAEYEDCSRLPLSLNIGGYKRQTIIKPKPKVAMCLSTGRFGPIDLYHGVAEMCRQMGWPLFQWGGDNWAKVLTKLIRKAIAETDCDYILTLDFDSCFDANETIKLVEWMQEHPEVGAVWPVQAHRHADLPLGYSVEAGAQGYYDYAENNPWKGEFTPYGSGHFGCTVIRRQVFDLMPQPWLAGLPSVTTQDWEDDALDNDIAFWVSMTAHGWTFGQLNTVQIGHMEWCCKWVYGGKIGWQPIQNYRKFGRPKNAVFDGEAWNKQAKELMLRRLGLKEVPESERDTKIDGKEIGPSQPGPSIATDAAAAPASAPKLDIPILDIAAEKHRVGSPELASANGSFD